MTRRQTNSKKLFCFLILLLSVFQFSFSQQTTPDQHDQLLTGSHIIQAKNYYLLTLFRELPDVRNMLESDAELTAIGKNKSERLSQAMKDDVKDPAAYTDQMKFSAEEIQAIDVRLKALYQPGNALGKLVRDQLTASGAYNIFQHDDPQQRLISAFEQDARGINFTIGVYAEGRRANYPLIDSCSLNTKSPRYSQFLFTATQTILDDCERSRLFFLPSLMSALRFLELNERYNAADFEPLASGENKVAFERVKKINWNNYKYSVILIPGAGPNDPKVPLSAEGLLRCRLAARLYFEGLAPFIMPSGGRVHPYKTIYSEAFEMKKYLMEHLNIPEDAIIMEPHARHTTTNLRNGARLIYRYGIPFSKPALACTSRGQSSAIGKTLAARCQKELNTEPFKVGNRLSDTEVEFYPLMAALTINPLEPLDP